MIIRDTHWPPRRLESLRGAVQVDVVNGEVRLRSWPRSRPGPKTAKQRDVNDKFAQAQRAWKWLEPAFAKFILEQVEGTPLLPRDLLTATMFNRLFLVIDAEGKVMYPVQSSQEVSEALDTISQTPGTILIRGDNLWAAIPLPGLGADYTMAERLSDQLISAATWTQLNFTSAPNNALGAWSAGSAARLTVPAGVSLVRLTAGARGSSTSDQLILTITKNNEARPSSTPGLPTTETDTAGEENLNLTSAPIQVTAGDYFRLSAWSTNSRNIGKIWFSMEMLG